MPSFDRQIAEEHPLNTIKKLALASEITKQIKSVVRGPLSTRSNWPDTSPRETLGVNVISERIQTVGRVKMKPNRQNARESEEDQL